MLEYIQLYPETLAAVKRYPAADRALLYEAMVSYGTEGAAPDWPEDDLKWLIWESLRQRVDMAARKSETNRNNRKRNGTNQNETERTGTNQNETERNETNRNPEPDAESEPDAEPEDDPVNPVDLPVERAHTQGTQQGDSAGAGAGEESVPAGWYDPEHPDRPCDAAWLASPQARKSIAQRILDHVIRRKVITPGAITADSGRTIGREIMEALQAAMAAGKSPAECQRLAQEARALWVWEIRLKEAALLYGTAPPGMAAAWREDVAELSAEAEEVALYG